MSAQQHYERLLAPVYSWMAGDAGMQGEAFEKWCREAGVPPGDGRSAVDLGCGHGVQTLALARYGYSLIAIDQNEMLLGELRAGASTWPVRTVKAHLSDFAAHLTAEPHLIVCWGDTLTHLDSETQVAGFLRNCAHRLAKGGMILLSFRDYTKELAGTKKVIPVRSDENRILTCVLDYYPGHVEVTDILHEREAHTWTLKSSTYRKVAIGAASIYALLSESGLSISSQTTVQGMEALVAVKK